MVYQSLMLGFLPSPPNSFDKICLGDLFPAGEITSSNLRVNLHARIRWDKMVYQPIRIR